MEADGGVPAGDVIEPSPGAAALDPSTGTWRMLPTTDGVLGAGLPTGDRVLRYADRGRTPPDS